MPPDTEKKKENHAPHNRIMQAFAQNRNYVVKQASKSTIL